MLLSLACEPLDQAGADGSLHSPGIAANGLGREDVSRDPSAGPGGGTGKTIMQEVNFDQALALILHKDPRYHREAYLFVREALDHTQKAIVKEKRVRHVSGQELLVGIRDLALAQFGPMAATVLAEWGVHKCEDFGEVVFNMVEIGLLAKTEKDSRADFAGGYDFQDAFSKPFLPRNKRKSARSAPASSSGN